MGWLEAFPPVSWCQCIRPRLLHLLSVCRENSKSQSGEWLRRANGHSMSGRQSLRAQVFWGVGLGSWFHTAVRGGSHLPSRQNQPVFPIFIQG